MDNQMKKRTVWMTEGDEHYAFIGGLYLEIGGDFHGGLPSILDTRRNINVTLYNEYKNLKCAKSALVRATRRYLKGLK